MSALLARLKTIPYLPLLTALTVLRLVTAARADLVPDESYYWLWAQHPAFGYFDHPPMVAWWIGAFTTVFGHSPFAVRLPFVLSFIAASWLMYDAARRLFDANVAKRTLLWLNACLLLSVGSVIATPDPPSVLMWVFGLWALARLKASGNGVWWLVFGLAAGLGIEAKYTNFFLGLGVVAWMILDRDARRWLVSPSLWLGALVAMAAMAPNLIWNATHGYATLAKQFGRIDSGGFTLKFLVELIISQPLLLNPLIFVFFVTAIKTWLKDRASTLTLLIALPVPLVAYLFVHVFHDRIQGNWPAPVFPGLVLLAAASAETVTGTWLRRLRDWAAPFGITISVLALVYLGLGNLVSLSGAAGLSQGWDTVTGHVRLMQVTRGAAFVATVDYDTEGELSFHLPDVPVIGMAERERYGWPTNEKAGQTAIIVVPASHTPDLYGCFDDVADLGPTSRGRKPNPRSDFHLYSGRLKAAGCEIAD
ncbi:ArnT family glycosyltransferase [Asticcacaulis solisilvae]|uniref:ArnT family glycosyltransferase n=1 Tax=Asticcacaulis solisilvae TaxID=1217274 RepID=UPI003FD6CC33